MLLLSECSLPEPHLPSLPHSRNAPFWVKDSHSLTPLHKLGWQTMWTTISPFHLPVSRVRCWSTWYWGICWEKIDPKLNNGQHKFRKSLSYEAQILPLCKIYSMLQTNTKLLMLLFWVSPRHFDRVPFWGKSWQKLQNWMNTSYTREKISSPIVLSEWCCKVYLRLFTCFLKRAAIIGFGTITLSHLYQWLTWLPWLRMCRACWWYTSLPKIDLLNNCSRFESNKT